MRKKSAIRVISSSQKTYCIQVEYTFAQNVIKRGRVRINSHAGIFIVNVLFLLTILPAGSDMRSVPPADRYIRFSLENPSARSPLSLSQGVGFGTAHKHTGSGLSTVVITFKSLIFTWPKSD